MRFAARRAASKEAGVHRKQDGIELTGYRMARRPAHEPLLRKRTEVVIPDCGRDHDIARAQTEIHGASRPEKIIAAGEKRSIASIAANAALLFQRRCARRPRAFHLPCLT